MARAPLESQNEIKARSRFEVSAPKIRSIASSGIDRHSGLGSFCR